MTLNKSLIEWIYESIDVSRLNYKMLTSKSDLSRLLTEKYYLSGNYSGNNCFLVFTQVKGRYYAFLVERKMLSYSLEKINWDTLRITNINATVDQAIYKGSIFDGIYFNQGNENRFTITNVYMFKGSDYTQTDLRLKLDEVRSYLERLGSQLLQENYNKNSKINLDMDVNSVYDNWVDNFDDIINAKLHTSKTMVRGICFYPEKSGTKLFFNYEHYPNILNANMPKREVRTSAERSSADRTGSDRAGIERTGSERGERVERTGSERVERIEHKKTHDTDQQNETSNSDTPVSQNSKTANFSDIRKRLMKRYYTAIDNVDGKEVTAVLRMEPTSLPDNYDMYCVKRIGKNTLKKEKRDIAYIPNAEKSKWLRDLFINDNSPKLMNCVWRDDRRKWEPVEVNTTAKLPTLASKLDEYLVEIEESDSESDFE